MKRALLVAVLVALGAPTLAWAPPREANLVARIVSSPTPAAGEIAVVTASVQNRGPDSVLDGTLVVTMPTGLTLVAAHPTQGSCTGTVTVTCALGLLGRLNQAFDATASVRLLARIEQPGAYTVTAEASAPTATETIPDDNRATRTVVVAGPAARSASRLLVKLVSATTRRAVVRITCLGPSDASRLKVSGHLLGDLAAGAERTVTLRFAKARRRYSITVQDSTSATDIDVRL